MPIGGVGVKLERCIHIAEVTGSSPVPSTRIEGGVVTKLSVQTTQKNREAVRRSDGRIIEINS